MKDDQKDHNCGEVGREHRDIPRVETKPTSKLDAAPSFTPGPWEVHEPLACEGRCGYPHNRTVVVHRDYELLLADCGTRYKAAKANARLIAAAPALYAELVKARDTFNDFIIPLRIMRRGLMADACEIARDSMNAALALANTQDTNTPASSGKSSPIR